ncbi:hypothetical protein J3R80_04340 [Aliiroseovarius sp. Z3]|uniref:hypothetical protein n=1 Tax=Aliiroseovarius sp. Z3 TaxID=2811402 RepID=UPI0023B26EE8|nr:hypothetical protein [Aliiroseovarius sp. Z3]MDE9449696.1 hypothetical protein [Aliiroseovarius sp. Z3]
MKRPLTQLAELAALQHDAAMATLAQHNRAIQTLELHISNLRQRLHTAPESEQGDAFPLALTSGHYGTWQRWVERELTKLNCDLARARADRESVVQNARLAFGRKSATEALVDKEKQAQQMKARKRFEQSVSQGSLARNLFSFDSHRSIGTASTAGLTPLEESRINKLENFHGKTDS